MDPATSLIMLSAAEGVLIFILVQFLLGGGVKYGGKVLKYET